MSRENERNRLMTAGCGLIAFLTEHELNLSAHEMIAVLDGVRFALMQSLNDDLGDLFTDEAGQPTDEEIARWEDDGGSVRDDGTTEELRADNLEDDSHYEVIWPPEQH